MDDNKEKEITNTEQTSENKKPKTGLYKNLKMTEKQSIIIITVLAAILIGFLIYVLVKGA